MDANEAVVFPQDLSALSLDELTALQTRALAEFDTLAGNEAIDEAGVTRLETLAGGIEAVEAAVVSARSQTRAASGRSTAMARIDKVRSAAQSRADEPAAEDSGAGESDGDGDGGGDEGEGTVAAKVETATTKPTPAPAPTRTAPRAASLAAAQANAPAIPNPETAVGGSLTIVAAAPASGIQVGSNITDIDTLVRVVQAQARSAAITNGQPGFQLVASVQNDFEFVLDGEGTKPAELEDLLRHIRTPDRIDSLVAAGGWCAPSETRYDFFNIACDDGMIDLPTIGIRRGGLRWPVSPSLADVFTGTFTNATNPWVWTEADDILAATGSPTKPCVRVPCAGFDEARLECYGICLTAGNLTDNAWPEATRNFLKLLMSAHYHAMNQRYIQQMVTLSTSSSTIPSGSCRAISTDLPDIVGLAAQDYRTRFGMCDDDVLEIVLPRWARDAIRSDLSRRTGVDPTNFSNADIDRLFTARRVRIQWVADWQIRTAGQPGGATPLLAWPDTVTFMIYAAGTFFRGNGMSLDLGVVRDSVLNATNDHTAAWSEECHLIGRQGHQSRLYTLPVCVGGLTGGTCSECHVA